MKIASIKFVCWDKAYDFSANDLDVRPGDKVVVKTDLGLELGDVIRIFEASDSDYALAGENGGFEAPADNEKEGEPDEKIRVLKPILRKATLGDLEKKVSHAEKREALEFCRDLKERHNLPMKFIDVHYSLDNSRLTFAFIADGRIDFRELVKDMNRHFNRSIRLQQIGIRDEAKIMGDAGHCGRQLCCRGHLKSLESISSDMAELQECAHRGSDRISGICGRLMCCLAYEHGGYEELSAKLPAIGTRVNVDGRRGVVVGRHALKQSVNVEFEDKESRTGKIVVEVDLNRHKK